MYEKIAVAYDGSPGARKALDAAIVLAKQGPGLLQLVAVEELPRFPASIDEIEEERTEAERRFAPMLEEARLRARAAGVALHAHLLPGHVVATIVEFVREHHIDLLVVGFMGHSQLYDRIIGSTTDRLVRLAPCSVQVVK
jgi:nucleotide-binding universal stress UspA family protein